jgi:23S rRNA (guanosine2251-2'-O)-methyltransferase
MKKKDILFGKNTLVEALKTGSSIDQIYISKTAQAKDFKEIYELALQANVPIRKVPIEKINYILYPFYQHEKINHQGIIAFISEFEYQNIDDIYNLKLDEGKAPLFLYLDHLTDVRNFGAISRSALCFGVDAILLPSRNSVTVSADAQKTSAGALMHFPICRTENPLDTLRYFKDCGMQILGATEKSKVSFKKIDWTLPTILVLGSEGLGMHYKTLELLTEQITIPMLQDNFDSLNVSVSAGILLSEAFSQRI